MSMLQVFSKLGDIMSTLGDIIKNVGKVIGKTIEFVWKPQCTHDIPHIHHGISQCTPGIPPHFTEHPSVLSDFPQCTEYLPVYCTLPG